MGVTGSWLVTLFTFQFKANLYDRVELERWNFGWASRERILEESWAYTLVFIKQIADLQSTLNEESSK